MYAASFDYHRPRSVAEATKLLGSLKDAKVLAGGHSLLPAMKLRVSAPAALVDIGGIKELVGIKAAGNTLQIGALTTHAAIAASDVVRKGCPILAEAAGHIGDIQVRNRGTLGGSLAHGDPASDEPTVILLLGAKLTAVGPSGQREIPAENFFVDLFTTDLRQGELLTSIAVPTYGAGTGGAYLKHRHPASNYAVVGVAALVELKDGKCARVGLTVGGVTAKPARARAAEQALTGQAPDQAGIARAAERVAEALKDPLSDLYASGEYRIHLATVMARRALATAAEKARR
ncbi:MAG TPA: xanthine dehydrogenase family protein subunit M [Vicinamibacteria bacterium]